MGRFEIGQIDRVIALRQRDDQPAGDGTSEACNLDTQRFGVAQQRDKRHITRGDD